MIDCRHATGVATAIVDKALSGCLRDGSMYHVFFMPTKEQEILNQSIKNLPFSEGFKSVSQQSGFNKIGEIKATGDHKWKTLLLPVPEKTLTGYIGPVYHLSHYHLLNIYQDTFNSKFFKNVLKNYKNSVKKGTDPFLMLNPVQIDLTKAEKTKVKTVSPLPEPSLTSNKYKRRLE